MDEWSIIDFGKGTDYMDAMDKPDLDELERLSALGGQICLSDYPFLLSAARENEKLRERVKELEDALRPFSGEAERYDPDTGDGRDFLWDCSGGSLRINDLRRAHASLKEKSDD